MTAISNTYNINSTKIDTTEALWAIISSQPRKVRKALALRLQSELPQIQMRKTGLEKALEDVEKGRVSGPFHTPEELFKHLDLK